MEQIDQEIQQVSADSGYDTFDCYKTITERFAKAVIPPHSSAKIQQHANYKELPHPRDENIRRVRQVGSNQWKQESAYHRRSLSD